MTEQEATSAETTAEEKPKAEKQMALLPQNAPKGKFMRVKTEDFSNMKLICPAPTKAMIESVQAVGVFTPVLLFKDNQDRWKIGAGLRRISSALIGLEAGSKMCEDIPAMVYTDEVTMRQALTLIENTQRSSNPLAEVKAIIDLQKKHFSVQQIADGTGMPVKRIEKRLRLNKLEESLLKAVMAGKIKVTVGEQVAELPMPYQKKLAAVYAENKKLRAGDVAAIKEVRQKDSLSEMPSSLYAEPEKEGSLSAEEELAQWKAAFPGKSPADVLAMIDGAKSA